MKSPECVCKTSEEYIRVALALETLAYHDKNYLDSTFAKSNAAISEEIQACLQFQSTHPARGATGRADSMRRDST